MTVRGYTTQWTPSPAFNARRDVAEPDMLVMHYTAGPMWRAVDVLASPSAQVSSHYLVSDTPGPVLHLVDERQRAWHAGVGSWCGHTDINSRSIGIENVGWGYTYGPMPPMPPCPSLRRPLEVAVAAARRAAEALRHRGIPVLPRHWAPFPPAQMTTLCALSQDIVERYHIAPENVVGHGDVSPGRKVDPGPMFPWEMLAAAGVGDWPSETSQPMSVAAPTGISVPWMQAHLASWGYRTPQSGVMDPASVAVLAAFQMHFRPSQHDGVLDEDSMRRLQLLLHQRAQRRRGFAPSGAERL